MNEPLTLEQLMRTENDFPVYVKRIATSSICRDGWCEIEFPYYDTAFAKIWWPGSEVEDYASIEDYGKTWFAYAYPPAHIDREAWGKCEYCTGSVDDRSFIDSEDLYIN